MLDPEFLSGFEDFEYRKELIPEDLIEQDEFFEALEKKFEAELTGSAKAKKYLSRYFRDGGDFLKYYAHRKTILIRYYEHYMAIQHAKEIDNLKYQKEAEDALGWILQKKLFNLQVQWRANKIQIEEIEVSYDFYYWSEMIFSCPFLPKITPHEVDLLKEFILNSREPEMPYWSEQEWQNYEELTDKDERGFYWNMPEWYDFYDNRMGTGMLLLLPDVRSEIERRYHIIAVKHRNANKAERPAAPPPDDRPIIDYMAEEHVAFARTMETDPCIRTLFDAYEKEIRKENEFPEDYIMELAMNTLKSADRPIHLESHVVWHEAILRAAKDYKNQRIVENIDFVYQQYLMLKELGLHISPRDGNQRENMWANAARNYKEAVLEGRRLCGEPENFDF